MESIFIWVSHFKNSIKFMHTHIELVDFVHSVLLFSGKSFIVVIIISGEQWQKDYVLLDALYFILIRVIFWRQTMPIFNFKEKKTVFVLHKMKIKTTGKGIKYWIPLSHDMSSIIQNWNGVPRIYGSAFGYSPSKWIIRCALFKMKHEPK